MSCLPSVRRARSHWYGTLASLFALPLQKENSRGEGCNLQEADENPTVTPRIHAPTKQVLLVVYDTPVDHEKGVGLQYPGQGVMNDNNSQQCCGCFGLEVSALIALASSQPIPPSRSPYFRGERLVRRRSGPGDQSELPCPLRTNLLAAAGNVW